MSRPRLTFWWREVETKSFKNEKMGAEDPTFEGRLEVAEESRSHSLSEEEEQTKLGMSASATT